MFNIIKMWVQSTLENPIIQTKTVYFQKLIFNLKLLKFRGIQTNYAIIFGNNIDLQRGTLIISVQLEVNRCYFELLKC